MEENNENINNEDYQTGDTSDELNANQDLDLSQNFEDDSKREVAEILQETEIVEEDKDTDDIITQEEKQDKLVTVRPVKFQEFSEIRVNRAIKKNLDILQNVSMHVSVELGKKKSTIREVMEMDKGSVVELNKIAGEQVEIYVNDKLVAKGEVIVMEDKFGVRVTSTNLPKENV